MEAPKLFISYSWSNPIHEQWVLDLATDLRESGVDVILDKWDLKEGHDAIAFMEKMVNDPKIKKVAIISDEVYVAKADGRRGGVGTETQIISKEVYDKQDQNKFVVIVAQKDATGKPYLPTYYKSRIYIDLSDPDKYSENFEKLLRWIFDKPLYTKPELGKKPAFLEESQSVSLGTTPYFKRTIDALKNSKPFALGALDEYLNRFVKNLEKYRIDENNQKQEFDELVVKSIESFLPHRNELIQLFITIAQYTPNEDVIKRVHRFIEKIVPYMFRPEHITQWQEWDFDNFRFLVHEIFLYLEAILIKYERFNLANYFMEQRYYLPGNSDYGRDVMVDFTVCRQYMRSLEYRNKRMKLNRLSLRADLLKQRCSGIGIDFRYMLQADFVLFMRAEMEAETDWNRWWPETLLYLGYFHSPFEIFARAKSKKYFDKMKCLLGIESPTDLNELLLSYNERKRELPRWQFKSFNPAILLNYEQLAKRP